MKYSEFKSEVEKLGLHIYVYHKYIDVGDVSDNLVGCISKTIELSMDTEYEHFKYLQQEKRDKLFEALYKLAKTPLAEREEEKRYYLKYNVPSLIVWGCSKNPRWLHVVRNSGYSFICEDRTDHEIVQTIFTESEIERMDISGFTPQEVPAV